MRATQIVSTKNLTFSKNLEKIISENGKMYFTTLVKTNRFADKYLEALANNDKLVSRTVADHKEIFDQIGISAKYVTTGNIVSIYSEK